jgi:hypothetical protein
MIKQAKNNNATLTASNSQNLVETFGYRSLSLDPLLVSSDKCFLSFLSLGFC